MKMVEVFLLFVFSCVVVLSLLSSVVVLFLSFDCCFSLISIVEL